MRTTARAMVCAAVLAAVSAASAQVAPVGGGNVLDANTGVGSGGVNSPVARESGINGQLYINGQVTGLGSFRGRVGYFPSDQLRLRLPSAGLVDFRRESVGLPNVLSGPTFVTRPYFDRSVTALTAGDIAAGRNAPGTNLPRGSLGLPQARQLYEELAAEYKSIGASQMTVPPLTPSASLGHGGVRPTEGATDGRKTGASGRVDEFGRTRPEDDAVLARELWDFQRLNRPMDGRLDMRIESLLSRPGEQPREGAEDGLPPGQDEPPASETTERETARGSARTGSPGSSLRVAPAPGENADAFLDVMAALRRSRVETGTTAEARTLAAGRADGATTRPAGRIVETDASGVVIRSLAGLDRGLFNLHMAKGQERLKAGRFYDAVEEFHLAEMSEPRNPLALMGMCAGRLGAGEPVAAGDNLYDALKLFPPLMETRLDLLRLMDTAIIERRMAELDRLLQEDKDGVQPRLALLAAYAGHSLGQEFLAKSAARKLQRSAAGDKLLLAFAEFILTGRRAGQDAQAGPAGSAATAPAR